MAQRVYPVAKVELYEPGREYRVTYDGFGQHDVLADLIHGGRITVQPTAPGALGRPGLQVPSAMLVDNPKVNTVIARPFLDTTQAIGLGHFGSVTRSPQGVINHVGAGEYLPLAHQESRSDYAAVCRVNANYG